MCRVFTLSCLFLSVIFGCSGISENIKGTGNIKIELGENAHIDSNSLLVIVKYKHDPLRIQDELESRLLAKGFSIKPELPAFNRNKYIDEIRKVANVKAGYVLIYRYYTGRNLLDQVTFEDFFVHIYDLKTKNLILKLTYSGSQRKGDVLENLISQISKITVRS